MSMETYPLARRDILTLAGLASISPFVLEPPPLQTRSAGQADARRRELYGLMGDLPARTRPIGGKKRGEAERDGYMLETWDLDLNGIETVPAYLARPLGATGRLPAVLFNHSHGGGYKIGKQEFVDGRSYLQPVPYAKELTGLGYVSLAIDHWIFDERIKVTVDINCLTDFQALLARKALSLHGVYYFVPGLIKHFTTAQINALIAPRAHLGLAGLRDKLTPVEGLDVIDKELQQVYAKLGHPERWKLLRYDVEHQETPEGRQEIIAFLKKFL